MPPTTDSAATDPRHPPDWLRFFPDADHRWTMGLRRGDAAAFLAPGALAAEVLAERTDCLATDPELYAALTPAAEPGLRETLTLLRSCGVTQDCGGSPWDQLLTLGRGCEPDLVWLVEDGAGEHRVAGGVVCFPSSWGLRDKLGRTLSETHQPVPGLNAALDRAIETFLHKLVPGEAWLRENAGYSRSRERNQHPHRSLPRLDASVTVDDVCLRLEQQLLLKLPASRTLLFGIRVEVVPLGPVLAIPQVATRVARLLRTISPEAAGYKGLTEARDVILAHLRRTMAPSDSSPPSATSNH